MLITSYVFWTCVLTLDQWTQRWLVGISSDHFLRFAESFRWLDSSRLSANRKEYKWQP